MIFHNNPMSRCENIRKLILLVTVDVSAENQTHTETCVAKCEIYDIQSGSFIM